MTEQQADLEANKAIVRRYRELHNRNDLDALDAIVAADLITHNLLPGLPSGLAGGKLSHAGFLAASPKTPVSLRRAAVHCARRVLVARVSRARELAYRKRASAGAKSRERSR